MPMIRYDTGDMATATNEICACGRGYPLIGSIDGRVTDFIKLEDGTLIPYLYFNYFFEQYGKFVRDFQVEQLDLHNVFLRIVKNDDLDQGVENRIISGLCEKLGDDVNVKIKYLNKIPLTKAGKKRVVIGVK
jgi:phenylacetate-CoA ligase